MALKIRSKRRLAAASSGFAVGLVAVSVSLLGLFPEALDDLAYDTMMRATADPEKASDRIVLVKCDEGSLQWVERELRETWPWPREFHGILLSTLRGWGARVVAFDLLLDRERVSTWGWRDSEAFVEQLKEAGGAVLAGGNDRGESLARPPRGHGVWVADQGDYEEAIEGAGRIEALGRDAYLEARGEGYRLWIGGFQSDAEAVEEVASMGTGVLPLIEGFVPDAAWLGDRARVEAKIREHLSGHSGEVPAGAEAPGADAYLQRFRLAESTVGENEGVTTFPQPLFLQAAAGFGIAEQHPDADGIIRRIQLISPTRSGVLPSLPLAIYLASERGHVPVAWGPQRLTVGNQKVPVEADGRALLRLHGVSPYDSVSAKEVLNSALLMQEGKAPTLDPARFADRIVIVAGSAVSLMDRTPTPLSPDHIGSDVIASVVDALIVGRWIRRAPAWLMILSTLLMGIFAALLGAYATEPRPLSGLEGALGSILRLVVRGLMAAVAMALVIGPLLVVAIYLFGVFDFWIPVALPIFTAGAAMVSALGVLEYVEYRDRRVIHKALGIYTSDLVANLVATGGVSALDARRDDITVFFSDLEGFTSFSEDLEPEQLSALLSEYLTAMTDVILEHEGVVDKYIGDAIMAFWGWRETQPDHATRGVRCALAMGTELDRLRPSWEARFGVTLKARAGLNSGVAVVGNLGSAQKMSVTLMGDVVNLASRLEGANKAYGTYLMVGEATREATGDAFEYRELDLLQVKGKARPVRVFEPLMQGTQGKNGALHWRDRFEAGLLAFRAQRFDEARTAFREVLDLRPGDPPARLFLERSEAYARTPPGAGWEGAFVMTSK